MYWQSEKVVKQQYLLHMSPQYGEFRPSNGWYRFGSLKHPSKFQRLSRLDFVTAAMWLTGDQQNFVRSLAVSWACTLHIHFWGLLLPNGILPGAKFTLRPSLAFSYIGSVTARHSSSGRQPNFCSVVEGMELRNFRRGAAYIRQGGHHVGHRPALLIMQVTSLQYMYHRKWANYI